MLVVLADLLTLGVAVVLLFALIGILAAAVPWLISVLAPTQVEARLTATRVWLVGNHSVIMTVLFTILGVKLIASGVMDLAG